MSDPKPGRAGAGGPDVTATALDGSPDEGGEPESLVRAFLLAGARRRVQALDGVVDRGFDRLRGSPGADRLFYSASALGDFSLLWHLVATALAVRSKGQREAARLMILLGVESVLVNTLVKSLFRRARPLREEAHPLQLRLPRSSSFPSGHATSGFMAATLLVDGHRRPAVPWYSLAAVVAASRVHVRIHHASDVVAGAVTGLAMGHLARWLWPLPPARPKVSL